MKMVILQIVQKIFHLLHSWIFSGKKTTGKDVASIKFYVKTNNLCSHKINSSKEVKDEEPEHQEQFFEKEEQEQ